MLAAMSVLCARGRPAKRLLSHGQHTPHSYPTILSSFLGKIAHVCDIRITHTLETPRDAQGSTEDEASAKKQQ